MKSQRLLSKNALEKLRPLLNYVNVSSGSGSELSEFCKKHQVPTKICIERPDGSIAVTRDSDRKAILLARIIKYLETGIMPAATTFPCNVVCHDTLPKRLKKTDRVYYGQYKNGDETIAKLLLPLTGQISTYCAVGQEVIRGFWSEGVAPTYAEFSKAFVKAYNTHKTSDNPEWAYLNDLKKAKQAGNKLSKSEWRKEIRPAKAREALDILATVRCTQK